MKKTILIILAIILIIVLSVAYYCLVFIPQRQTKEKQDKIDYLFSKELQCQTAGQNYYQQPNDSYPNFKKFLDKYTYNEKLNTCLIAYGMNNDTQTFRVFFVTDALSAKELLQYRMIMHDNDKIALALGYDTGSYIMMCDDTGDTSKNKCSNSLKDSIKAAYDKRKTELVGQ